LWNNVTLANAPPGPNESEDCLFLDVWVSNSTFHKKNAPVLVWIHGGGYIRRDKTEGGSPIGLLERSRELGDSAVFVALGYRVGFTPKIYHYVELWLTGRQLGAFGFLSGPNFESDGTPNVGLHDQRLALEWVRENIHLFGGDRGRVTVIGESAGGSSIMHHIAAYGGAQGPGRLPFQQAICQSAAIHNPTRSPLLEDQTLQLFLHAANVSTITEARELPSDVLMRANKDVVRVAPYGLYIFRKFHLFNLLLTSILSIYYEHTPAFDALRVQCLI
jgi:carboxylesterase type B